MKRAFALLLIFSVVVGARDAHAAPPNVLILFSDDQRPDTIHALGNEQIRTPHLDRLVRDGVAFTQAHIMGGNVPAVCVPSRAMLLSGRSLFRVDNQLARENLLPATFAAAGYETFGTGKWHNGAPSYLRAFNDGATVFLGGMNDQFKMPVRSLAALRQSPQGPATIGEKFSSELFADSVIEFLGRKRTRPFFCYAAFTAPHDPRQSPGEYATMYDPAKIALPANFAPLHPVNNGEMTVRDEQLAPWPRTPEVVRRHLADYYGIISHLDSQVGRILNALEANGQLENTIIVFAGDSGLAVGSHGLFGKQNVYEHSVGMPLLIAGPGIPRDRRTAALCYTIDIFPTLCELAGVTTPSDVEGQSLTRLLHGETDQHRDTLLFAYRDVQRAVRDRQFKLIRYPQINKSQLFDLTKDPQETTDLVYVPDMADKVAEMTRLLEKTQAEWGDTLPLTTDQPQPYRLSVEQLTAAAKSSPTSQPKKPAAKKR